MNKFLLNMKKHMKLIIVLSVTALLCLTFSLLNGIISKKSALDVFADFEKEVAKKMDEEIADNYWVGEEVNLPSSIIIPDGNTTVTAKNGLVVRPDNIVDTVGKYTFAQAGNYTIKYFYEKDGKTEIASKQVFVGNKLASLASENGSITAVSSADQEGLTFENNASNATLSGEDALIVRMQEGNVFYYNKSIDLSQTDDNGLVDIISLNYHLRDVERGEKEFSLVDESARYAFIRITDSYDPTIYVDFSTTTIANTGTLVDRYMLFNTKAHNQTRYGGAFSWVEGWDNQTWRQYYQHADGKEYGIYHTYIPTLGPGIYDMKSTSHVPLTWKYDPVSQLVYVNYGLTEASATDRFLHDLSADTLYGDYVGFKGFPSGKVTLSIITSEWYSAQDARFDIFSIGKTDGAELVEEYKNGYHVDDVAPPVIDLGLTRTDGNKVFVPLNSKFTVPKPVAILGGMGVNNYKVNAYVNYGDSAEFEVPVVNGEISINKQAVYTIRYTATSPKGSVGEEILKLIVKDVPDALTLNTDVSFFNSNFESGQEITLPEYSITSINSEDAIKSKIKLVHDKYTMDVRSDTRSFVLQYSGEYKVVYEYSDNVYNLSKEFIINVAKSDNVGFIGTANVPRYFIKNAEYSLPDISGYTLNGGEHEKVTTVCEISYDNGSTWNVVDRAKVKITGDSTAIVRYTCGEGENKKSIVSEPSRIVDVGYGITNGLLFREYFVHDDFTILPYDKTLKNTDIKYTSNVTSGNNTLKFVNLVDYAEFEFKFKLNGNTNYKAVNVSLIDYEDPTIKYVLTYTNVGGTGYVSFNGAQAINTNTSFGATKSKIWAYNLSSNMMSFEGFNLSIDLRSYFKSAFCYLEVELVDIYGSADFVVDTVNFQSFKNNVTRDAGNPRISVDDFTGNYLVNDIVTLKSPYVTDVLTPVLDENIKLTVVYLEDGSAIKDINGVELTNVDGLADYSFKLTKLGEYKVTYTLTDGNDKTIRKPYNIYVVDAVKPEITFNQVDVSELNIKVGTTIDASFTATDDVTDSARLKTSLWVRDVITEAMYTVHNEKGLIKFDYAGKYRVYAFAQDQAGNYVYNSFLVNVTE